MAVIPKTPNMRLRVLLSGGEIPQWLGDLLLGLDGMDGISLQVVSPAASSSSRPASWLARAWRKRIPALARWIPDAVAIQRFSQWEAAASDACDVVLNLDTGASLPNMAAPGARQWVLVDGEGQPLNPSFPLLRAVSAGMGVHLALLERDIPAQTWLLVRSLHTGSTTRYAATLQSLSDAVRRLVGQALIDQKLGVLPKCQVRQIATPNLLSPCFLGTQGYLRYLWRRFQERALSEYWRIGLIDAPIHTLLQGNALPKVQWLTPEKRAGYWADPFALAGMPQQVFCEYFDERTGLGSLEVLTLDGANQVLEGRPLSVGKGRHASFPHVLEVDGRCLGVAETVSERKCVLHEVDAEGNWHPLFTLLSDVAAADPALFFRDGRWWLAFTDVDQGAMDNLCLYYADHLEGPWLPHANNPVKVDVAGARMAGAFFMHDGELYRPAQDCLQTYGAGVVVFRVGELSPERFSEEPVRRLLPEAGSCCPHGLHTLNAWGNRTLVDAKRHGVNPLTLWRNLGRRWGRSLFGRLLAPSPSQLDISGPLFRVMVYVPHLRVGGGEISMLRLAEGLAADGLDVCLVANSAETAELAIPPGVNFVSLGGHGTLSALWRLVRLLREYRPHWLLSAFPHTNIAAVMALRLSGVNARCVVTEHAPLSRQIAQQDNWRYRLLPVLVRWAYRRAHAVVGVSTGVRDDLRKMLGNGVVPHVIRNPVLAKGFESEMALAVDDPWLTDETLRVVLSVCRLSVEKDLPTLIKAFAEVHRERPETRLLMVGEGPDRERLEKLIAEMGLGDVVRLPGFTGRPLAWMRHAAVFVLSSRFEGFGNALVEAMACGTPVVSTDCPVGPREILEGGRLGDLVPVGDAPAMARAIGEALKAPGRFPEARETALRHTQAKSCASYRQLFESLYNGGALLGIMALPF